MRIVMKRSILKSLQISYCKILNITNSLLILIGNIIFPRVTVYQNPCFFILYL